MQKIVIISVLILLSIGWVTAQESVSPELQAQLDEIESTTSDIRNLDRLESTTLEFPTQDDLKAYLEDGFEEEFATDEFADDILFYVGLGLLEPDIDIETVLYDFLISQIAGYYDSEEQSMNVILMSGEPPTDNLPIAESAFYSHEYVHALQDQHFDLDALTDMIDESENADFQLAVLALIEGDASQVMTDYIIGLAQTDPTGVTAALGAIDSDIPDSVPQTIYEEFYFPYFEGQLFVMDLINELGWDAIDEAYTSKLPQSTEHIYHPDRYIAGDMPIEVEVPDMVDLLGDNWRLAQDIPVGEFYLRQHIKTQFRAGVAEDMTTGWGGDRINLYVDDVTADIVWVLYQVWDTPEDATEFADLYRDFLDSRFGTSSDDGVCWSGEDAMCFVQIGDDETRISFATQNDLALPMLGQTD
jgi:hypothetical protein